MEAKMTLDAYAKVNLGLDVLRRREDGYHEVRMIMQTISLHDVVTVEKTEKTGITITCSVPGIPTDERNLAYRAAKLLFDEFAPEAGAAIHLEKHIPAAAGMAGGSTDCAAVLRAVNELFGFGLTTEELCKRAVKLGADVPYCIIGGCALAEGIGEVLTVLPKAPACFVVTAKPPIDVPTKLVYESLHAAEPWSHPDIDAQLAAIEANDLIALAAPMGNVLASVTMPLYPVIGEIRDRMLAAGAVNAMMSGSGPTVFGLFSDRTTAKACAKLLSCDGTGSQVDVSEFVG